MGHSHTWNHTLFQYQLHHLVPGSRRDRGKYRVNDKRERSHFLRWGRVTGILYVNLRCCIFHRVEASTAEGTTIFSRFDMFDLYGILYLPVPLCLENHFSG